MFKWQANSKRALQAWHGYLGWGKWNDSLLVSMMPNYEDTFSVLHSKFGEHREKLCSHLAAIAVLSSIDPLKHGWLNRFLVAVQFEEREMWASSVSNVLQGTTEASKTEIWNRWMSKYWRNRIDGIPLPLSPGEVKLMALWVANLEPVFDQAVQNFCASPAVELGSDHIYYVLAESDVGIRHPTYSSKFLLHLLRYAQGPFWDCDYVEKTVEKILSVAPADKTDLLSVCDRLATLGCGNAAHLKKAILSA